MYLTQFECSGFRCLSDQRFEPGRGICVVRGDNAQGKTSLLEAILFTATSKSHRTSVETELVQHGKQGFRLCAQVRRTDRDVSIEALWHQDTKRFKVNGVTQTRISDILGKAPVVLFSPEDIDLVKGTAANRRKFLDMELSQVNPAYLNALQRYRQALRQRNELLRIVPPPDPGLLDVWDAQLAQFGEAIICERERFLAQLEPLAAEAYGRIAHGETLGLAYQPDVPAGQVLATVLAKSRASDLRRQTTARGPHRDEVTIGIDGQAARSFGSQGQQKTAALALKLAEMELVRQRTGEYPLLMLDEVLSELDEPRARELFGAIDKTAQCLVTTTTLTGREQLFGRPCMVYRIEKGALTKE